MNRIGLKRLVAAIGASALVLVGCDALLAGPPADVSTASSTAPTANAKAPSKYWLGIQCEPASDAVRDQLQLPKGQGLVVVRIVSDGPAAKAGIRPNDLLLSAGDKKLGSVADLAAAVETAKESPLTLTLLRGGKSVEVSAQPGLRPENPQPNLLPPGGDREVVERWLKQFGMNAPTPWGNGITLVHPGAGLVLPPGVNVRPELPDDMSVNIYREGKKPAEITVKKGKETWHATEDDLSKLPGDVRHEVEPLLHDGPVRIWFRELQPPTSGAGGSSDRANRESNNAPDAAPNAPEQSSSAQQLEELSRRINEMQRTLDQLRQRQEGQQGR